MSSYSALSPMLSQLLYLLGFTVNLLIAPCLHLEYSDVNSEGNLMMGIMEDLSGLIVLRLPKGAKSGLYAAP